MYVTRPLSMYKRNPAALSQAPPPGPHSGYLVILDEEAETYYGSDKSKDSNIKNFPFPQNKDLTIKYSSNDDDEDAMFVPVLNHPLSSNRYYVIRRKGKYRGQAITSSKEDDMETNSLCCSSFINDVKPRPLDPSNDYQIVEIIKRDHGFHAKSIAPDGIPPEFLRRKGWEVLHASTTAHNYHLDEALGSNDSLRAQLPDFNFPSSIYQSESVVVGKWYCPFMFVKEGGTRLAHQMKMSAFYKMTLEQRWEQIFLMGNRKGQDVVLVDVVIQTEIVKVGGRDAVWDHENGVRDRALWFGNSNEFTGAETSVGLSLEIVERMKWEQERVGWVAVKERQVRVEREERFGGTNKWKMFSCYVLVERFLLRRMDGKLVLTYDYKHANQIRCKWE